MAKPIAPPPTTVHSVSNIAARDQSCGRVEIIDGRCANDRHFAHGIEFRNAGVGLPRVVVYDLDLVKQPEFGRDDGHLAAER